MIRINCFTKKSLLPLFTAFVFLLTGCENFLKSEDVKKEIVDTIEYNNAPFYVINVETVDGNDKCGKIKTPATGEISKKVTDVFPIRFEPAEDHTFKKWEAEIKDLHEGEVPSDYIEFEDAESLETKVTFKKASSKVIVIRPVCPANLKVIDFNLSDPEKEYPKDSNIIITFNQPLAADCIDNISVKIPGIEDGKDYKSYFKSPELINNNSIAIYTDWDKEEPNYIPVAANGSKIISVNIPKDKIYYTCKDYPVTGPFDIALATDLNYTYTISSETSKQTNVKFLVDENTKGTLRVNEESTTLLSRACSVGKTISLKYKPNDGFFFEKWTVSRTYKDENGTEITEDIPLNELDKINLSISYPENEETFGVDLITNSAQAVITVNNYISGTITISPVNKPRVNILFTTSEDDTGTFRIDDKSLENQAEQYSIGKTISLKYKVNEGFKFTGWDISRTYKDENGADKTDIIPLGELDQINLSADYEIDENNQNVIPSQITISVNDYISGNIIIKPNISFIPVSGVEITGSHGKFSPGKATYSMREGDSKIFNFEADQDYQFIKWKIYNSVTNQEIPNGEYITIDNIDEDSCEVVLSTAPTTDDIQLQLSPVVVERPQIISSTPTYDAVGAYRDARIQVMFDNDMNPDSIYYSTDEMLELMREYELVNTEEQSDFLKVNLGTETNPNYKYYGYKKDNNIIYKNIQIKDNKTQGNILAYFGAPVFEDARTLTISTNKQNPPAGGTTILVNLDKNFSYLEDDKPVYMRESKKWVYFVNSSTDIVPPSPGAVKILNSDGREIKHTAAERVFVKKGREIQVGLTVSDNGSGPTGTFELVFSDNSTKISIPYQSVTGGSAICGSLESGTQDSFSDYYNCSLDELSDGDHDFTIKFQDKNGNSCYYTDSNKNPVVYYINVDTEEPYVSDTDVTLAAVSDTVNTGKTGIMLSYACSDSDFNGGKLLYRPAVSLDDENWENWTGAEVLEFAKTEKNPFINNLNYGTSYEIKAEFYDNANNLTSYYFKKNTMPAPLSAATDVTVDEALRTLKIDWKEKPEGLYSGVSIQYKTQTSSWKMFNYLDEAPQDNDKKYYEFTNIEYGATYTINITSLDEEKIEGEIYANNGKIYENSNGESVLNLSQITKPRGVSNVNIMSRLSSSIYLNFSCPYSNNYTKTKVSYAPYDEDGEIGTYTTKLIDNGQSTVLLDSLTPGVKYDIKLWTYYSQESNTCAESSYVNLDAWTEPARVTNLAAAPQQKSVTLSWTKPVGYINGYLISWGTGANQSTEIGKDETSYEVTGLTPGTQYTFTVISRQTDSKDTECNYSVSKWTYSAPVTNVQFSSVQTNKMTISWTKPEGNYKSIMLKYGTSSNNLSNSVGVTSKTSTEISGLLEGTMYYYRFETTSASSYTPNTTVTSVYSKSTEGKGVTNLGIDSNTTTSVKLKWDYPASWSKVQIQYKLTTASNWSDAATINYSSSANAYCNVTNLASGKDYNFKVITTVNVEGTNRTIDSLIDKVTKPNAITNLGVTSSDFSSSSIKITWTKPSGAYSGYKVYYKENTSSTWTTLSDSWSSSYSYYNKQSGLTAGTKYDFKVVVYSEGGELSSESTCTRCTKTAPISNLSFTNGTTNPSFSWTKPSGNYTGYKVYYRASANGDWISRNDSYSGTNTSYNVTGLTAGTYYQFKFVTYLSDSSDCDSTEVTKTFYTLPNAATFKANSSNTHNATSLYIYFNYPSGNYDRILMRYKKSSESNYTDFKVIKYTDSTKPSYCYFSGLEPNTRYDFQLITYSDSTTTYNNLRSNNDYTLPYGPSNLSASQSNGNITLSWSSPTGTARTGMRVYYKLSSSSSYSYKDLGVSATSYTFGPSDLNRNATYNFYVVAYGNYDSSATSTITNMTSPAAATNLSVDRDDGQGYIRLKWLNPSSSTMKGANIYIDGSKTTSVSLSSSNSSQYSYTWITLSSPRSSSGHTIVVKPYNTYNSTNIEAAACTKTHTNTEGNFIIDGTTYSYSAVTNIITSSTQINANNVNTGGAFTSSRNITLKAYSMGQYEVTVALYNKVMSNTVSTSNYPARNMNWYHAIAFCNKLSILMNRTPFYKVQKDTNVYYTDAEWAALTISDIPTTGSTNVTPNSSSSDRSTKAYYWKNANYNSSSNGYHLPTECQWEFAARGGSVGGTQWGYDYSGSNTASTVAWFNTSLSTVGQLQKNAKNLYDMSGNVWEWTTDFNNRVPSGTWYDPYMMPYDIIHGESYGLTKDGILCKGGAYTTSASDDKKVYYNSFKKQPWETATDVGFRICTSKTN